jgi:NUMOD4 motif/HNH endonuclease
MVEALDYGDRQEEAMTKRTSKPGEPRNDLPGERWTSIPGYDGIYEFSNLGRIYRISRLGADGRTVRSRILKTSINNGRLVAYLPILGKKKGRAFYIEKAILVLFQEKDSGPESLPGEEWKDIEGYEGLYQISNLGRILSLGRIIDDGHGRNRYIRARVRENGSDASGYPKVELARSGETKTVLVHRLVAAAFVPNPLGLPVVHHKDENRLNGRADNLEWITTEGNIQDWFDRRRVVVSTDTIERVLAAAASGKTPAEILASLPKKRKMRKAAG